MSNQDLIEEYIDFYSHSKQSQAMRKSSLNYFFKKYGYSGEIFDINTRELLKYFSWLKNLPEINLTTKKSKWSILTSFLNFIMEDPENDFMVKIPSKRVNWNGTSLKTDKSNREVYATKEELRQILDYFKVRNLKFYIIFKLFTFTGIRKGELINLRIDEIDIEERVIHLYIGKTMEKYYISPNDDFQLYFKMYLNWRNQKYTGDNYLFITNRNHPYSVRLFNKKLKDARDNLGITNRITCHTFRRTLNDFRKEMGCPLEDREQLLGHKTRNVNISGYTKQDIIRHRKLYDKWNPYKDLNF
ncbi:hypothetical protein LCGC14_0666480 [marine sediment metagenome]|uniref:Tyr recombinase domain-containing protein n=1 Tax=marine sediment metagenome TaxID=412755 RepID=A0A0F9RC88_9ZZZZ|nr:hypothetical protein [archaeon]